MNAFQAAADARVRTLARLVFKPRRPSRDGNRAAHEQLRRLRAFVPAHVWQLILSSSDEELLSFRQREIAVVFCDLRGFTVFARTAPSTAVVDVLGAYHRTIGPVIVGHNGVVERFTGDGLMIYFDDAPLEEQAERAVRMAAQIRDEVSDLSAGWRRRGYGLDVGLGIALGPATLGAIGFNERRDYAAIGPVTNLASRLCAEAAAGQVLVTERLYDAVRNIVDAERLAPRRLKGFDTPVEVYNVRRVQLGSTEARRWPVPTLEYATARG